MVPLHYFHLKMSAVKMFCDPGAPLQCPQWYQEDFLLIFPSLVEISSLLK